MNGVEIQQKINNNLKIIEEEARIGTFVLSPRASKAVEENAYLRSVCPHCYSELGTCIFCNKERS